MKLSDIQYGEMAKEASAPSKSWFNIPKAFVIGGLICVCGQGLIDLFTAVGLDKDAAGSFTSITLVLFSALLTAVDFILRWQSMAARELWFRLPALPTR